MTHSVTITSAGVGICILLLLVLGQTQSQAPASASAAQHAPPEMTLNCQMMMKMEVRPEDPQALLALHDDLRLTDEQAERLEQIASRSRDQALQVLNAEQQQTVRSLQAGPRTCMQMHREMMQKMKGGTGGMSESGKGCPMMQTMDKQPGEPPSSATRPG